MVFHHVYLSWIIDKNGYIRYEMDVEDSQWTEKRPWYNTTIRFEDYFRTGCKDRYELIFILMCITKSMYQCLMMQVVLVEYQCKVCYIKKHLKIFIVQSNFLAIGVNGFNLIMFHKRNLSELFNTFPKSCPLKKWWL